MSIATVKVKLEDILYLRNLFLQETNFQIRYNSYHERGWTDSYLLMRDDERIGYAAIKGIEPLLEHDTIFEFFVIPPFRSLSSELFRELMDHSKANFIECQSNDTLLTPLLYQNGQNIRSNVILFKEDTTTDIHLSGVIFRERKESDRFFDHVSEPVGTYVLELNNEVVATGGFLLHYNPPFADIYMEVREKNRKQGLGSFLVQELKKRCYLAGKVPAARCDQGNIASRSTLIKAGLSIAGYMLVAEVKNKK